MTRVRVRDAKAVDVDEEWGVAALIREGEEVRTIAFDGRPVAVFGLSEPAGDIVWIDAQHVAVTPTLAAHRIEIWDTKSGELIRTMGREQPIEARPGARFTRTVDLVFDHERDHLLSIESRRGDFQAFTLAGERIGRATLQNPRGQEFEEWLAALDRTKKEEDESHLQGLWYFRLSLAADGAAWIVRSCEEQGWAELVRVEPSGPPRTLEVQAVCCSTRSVVFGNHLTLHKPPGLAGDPCVQSFDLSRIGGDK